MLSGFREIMAMKGLRKVQSTNITPKQMFCSKKSKIGKAGMIWGGEDKKEMESKG